MSGGASCQLIWVAPADARNVLSHTTPRGGCNTTPRTGAGCGGAWRVCVRVEFAVTALRVSSASSATGIEIDAHTVAARIEDIHEVVIIDY
jgi:hypothetical protein